MVVATNKNKKGFLQLIREKTNGCCNYYEK